MTTIGSITPAGERRKPLVDGLPDTRTIQVDAEETWDMVGLCIGGNTKQRTIGVALDSKDIDKFIEILREAQRKMKK